MKRHRLMIRSWLTLAVTAASLVPASSAAAMLDAHDGAGTVVAPQAPVTSTPQGFDWTNLAIVVAVAVIVLIVAFTVAQAARNRSRLAPSH